ncbi:MAG: radical SAM family heme chaperone HemW [Chlamydiae bacterium]|nr:radical SAM family heme chaperone HemW [Chlamydiota bacterium]
MQTTGNTKEVSLYFHIPFCTKKCPYCHFYVVPNREELQLSYLAALEKEWQIVSHKIAGMHIVSIYFGGGTPSLLGPQKIDKVLQWIAGSSATISTDCEITLEANPENVTLELIKEFKACGINRISLGLQSMEDELLVHLGRGHSASKSSQAVIDCYEAGMQNISVDLMFELPHQNMAHWTHTLDKVSTLPITHLSLYNLVIEPHTQFHKKRKELSTHLPPEELCKEMLDIAVDKLETAGLKRYEISAFAKPGYLSRHNTGYWKARPFLGLGPSAFSYFDKKRFQNVCNLQKYCSQLDKGILPIDFEEELSFPANLKELLAVELRLIDGVNIEEFEKKHAKLPQEMLNSLKKLKELNLLEQNNNIIKMTNKGLLFYDTVAEEII